MKFRPATALLFSIITLNPVLGCIDLENNELTMQILAPQALESDINAGANQNQNIKKCYWEKRKEMDISETERLLEELHDFQEYPMSQTSVDKEQIQNYISTDYASLHLYDDTTAEEFVRIAKWQSNPLKTNKLIEKYFKVKLKKLTSEDFETLSDGLIDSVSNDYNDKEETQDRMSLNYYNAKRNKLGIDEVIAVATRQYNGLKQNMILTKYASYHIKKLSWGDLQEIYLAMFDSNKPLPRYHAKDELFKYVDSVAQESLTRSWERSHL